jgi:hypothetical protein
MKLNAQVRIGVMVSRETEITGKANKGDRDYEFVEGKLLIYLSKFESMSEDTLPNLMLLFRVFWEHDNPDSEAEESEAKADAIRGIEKLLEEARRAKTEWRRHKSNMEEVVRWMADRVEQTESRVREALALLQGNAKTDAAPSEVFKTLDDPRLTVDIQLILQHAEAEPSASCAMKDLADRFAKSRGISHETAKDHIRAVLTDKAVDAKPGRPTRVLGLRLRLPPPADE